jgi:hypothetical protein
MNSDESRAGREQAARPTNLSKKAASVSEGRSRGLNLIYLTGVVCVCIFACGAGVGIGGVAELVPSAGGKLSDEAGQSDGLEEFDGANQPDSSGSSDEVPLE